MKAYGWRMRANDPEYGRDVQKKRGRVEAKREAVDDRDPPHPEWCACLACRCPCCVGDGADPR